MAFGSQSRYASGKYDYELSVPNARPQRILAGAAFVCFALACSWTLCANLAGGDAGQINVAGTRSNRVDVASGFGDRFIGTEQRPALASNARTSNVAVASAAVPNTTGSITYATLFDTRFSLGGQPGMFAERASAGPTFAETFAARASLQANAQSETPAPSRAVNRLAQQTAPSPSAAPKINKDSIAQNAAASAPQPQPPQIRNASLHDRARTDRVATNTDRVATNTAAEPTFFEKLFGKITGKSSGPTLAYAAADDSGLGSGGSAAGLTDPQTAVYDISARTVYMPNGTRLEAHSGLGDLLDDPRHANERNRGVTPPTVYDLEMREAPFHGVEALRLIPVDESKVYGRSGLLAHTFMLGPNGDSNGCVSFKNYDAFLHAYKNGEVKRLVVVAGN
jgi:hypothetical protein